MTSDNESVVGGNGADVLTGNASANVLDGGAGNDALAGGGGDDTVLGGAGNDALDGGTANDVVDGGADNDTVSGGSGADDLRGGPGTDTLRARDGAVDRADCGADSDSVDADSNDAIAGCESGLPVPVPAVPASPLPTPFSFLYGVFKLPTTPVALEHGRVTLDVSCPAATPLGRCTGVISLERFGHKAGKGKAQGEDLAPHPPLPRRRAVLRGPRRQEGQGPRPHLERRPPRDQAQRHRAPEGAAAPHQACQEVDPHRHAEGAGVAPYEAPAREKRVLILRCAGAQHFR